MFLSLLPLPGQEQHAANLFNNADFTRTSTMKAEQAWQTVISQIQREMPKTTFDRWVDGAAFVSFEGGEYIIGAADELTRDWLESRLASTITRQLTGILNQEVTLTFVVAQVPLGEGEEEAQAEDEEPSRPESEKRLTVAFDFASAYSKVVMPHRKIVLPGYFRRHIAYLGTSAAWIYVGFFQLYYLCNRSSPVEVRDRDVVRWSGLSRATFWRTLGQNAYLKHFIRLDREIPKGKYVIADEKGRLYTPKPGSQQLQRNANRYHVLVDMPLTPADHAALRDWLLQAGIQNDPLQALSQSLEYPAEELLAGPDNHDPGARPEEAAAPVSIDDTVLSLCPDLSNEKQLAIHGLIEALREHLMPQNDLIFITWYFLQKWVPILGSGPAWAITLLRDKAFYNEKTGEIRYRVAEKRGWKSLAEQLKVNRPNTVASWFKPTKKASAASAFDWLDLHAEVIDASKNSDQSMQQIFHVQPREILAPEDLGAVLAELDIRAIAVALHQAGEQRQLLIQVSPENQHAISASLLDKNSYTTLIETLGQRESETINLAGTYDFETINQTGSRDSETIKSVDARDLETIEPNEERENETFNPVGRRDSATFNVWGAGDFETINFAGLRAIETITFKGKRDFGAFNSLSTRDFEPILKLLIKLVSGFLRSSYQEKEIPLTDTTSNNTSQPARERQLLWLEHTAGGWSIEKLFETCYVEPKDRHQVLGSAATAEAFVSRLIYAYSPQGSSLSSPLRYALSRLKDPQTAQMGENIRFDRLASLQPGELQKLFKESLLSNGYLELDNTLSGAYDWVWAFKGLKDKERLLELAELLGLVKISYGEAKTAQ